MSTLLGAVGKGMAPTNRECAHRTWRRLLVWEAEVLVVSEDEGGEEETDVISSRQSLKNRRAGHGQRLAGHGPLQAQTPHYYQPSVHLGNVQQPDTISRDQAES